MTNTKDQYEALKAARFDANYAAGFAVEEKSQEQRETEYAAAQAAQAAFAAFITEHPEYAPQPKRTQQVRSNIYGRGQHAQGDGYTMYEDIRGHGRYNTQIWDES